MKTKDELQAEHDALKLRHKTLFTIEGIPLDDDEINYATIFLKKADRVTHAAVSKLAAGADPLRAVEYLLKNLYVGGDELHLILDNDDALFSCETPLVEMLQKKTASLKKN